MSLGVSSLNVTPVSVCNRVLINWLFKRCVIVQTCALYQHYVQTPRLVTLLTVQ